MYIVISNYHYEKTKLRFFVEVLPFWMRIIS